MRSLVLTALLLILVARGVGEARAQARIALVIGNAAYEELRPLVNPANDAALMTETLLAVGFKVFELTNADQRAIKRAIRDFGKRLRRAGPEAVGLFYYAGHGVQADGTNYLIPLGAPIGDEADLELEAVSAGSVLAQMESAGNALNIVILDACRNNPFKSAFRAAGRGLARMNAPSGSLVAYAAAPGQAAADGPAGNSPYTAALAASIREPGLDLLKVFQRVRIAVRSETGGRQTPWEEQSLLGDFYFVPDEAAGQGASPRPPSPQSQEAAGIRPPTADAIFLAGHWCERIGQYLVRWEVTHLTADRVQTRMHHPAAPPRFLPDATVVPTGDGLKLDFAPSAEDVAPQVFTVLDRDTIRRDRPAPAAGMTGIRKRCRMGDEGG